MGGAHISANSNEYIDLIAFRIDADDVASGQCIDDIVVPPALCKKRKIMWPYEVILHTEIMRQMETCPCVCVMVDGGRAALGQNKMKKRTRH